MNVRGLCRYVDDLPGGRRPRPFDADRFEAAQLRYGHRIARRAYGRRCPKRTLPDRPPPPAGRACQAPAKLPTRSTDRTQHVVR
jgi:hypothetical protein